MSSQEHSRVAYLLTLVDLQVKTSIVRVKDLNANLLESCSSLSIYLLGVPVIDVVKGEGLGRVGGRALGMSDLNLAKLSRIPSHFSKIKQLGSE